MSERVPLVVRINAFARDIGLYLDTKSKMGGVERMGIESLLRRELDWLLRQDDQEIRELERRARFGE